MWSGDTEPRTIVTFRAAQICRIRSRARSAILARKIFFRYFVHLRHVVPQGVKRVRALPVFGHPSILVGMRRLEADRLKAVGLDRAMDTKADAVTRC